MAAGLLLARTPAHYLFTGLSKTLRANPKARLNSSRMPPRRVASTSKRKAASTSDESDAEQPSQSKKKAKSTRTTKAKADGGGTGEANASYPPQPTNVVLPTPIALSKAAEGVTRIATWNICGLAAASKKGFKFYVEAEDADVLILTETKTNEVPVDPLLTNRYPHRYWSIASKKGYAGTAVLSKQPALNVSYTLPGHPDPDIVKGRIVTLEFENLWLVATYVPNAGQQLKTLAVKEEWNKHFEKYLRLLDSTKPVVWAGDLNVAPTALDLTHAKPNWNKTPGYTASETEAYARILNPPDTAVSGSEDPDNQAKSGKMVDVWRQRHPDWKHFTYFSYRFQCRQKGIGWRLDMFVVSEQLVDKVKECEIRSEIYGASDHCPVILDVLGQL